MIVTCVGMNSLMIVGLVIPAKKPPAPAGATSNVVTLPPPTVSLTVNPAAVAAGGTSALNWTTTGNVSTCTASSSWSGDKTPFGAESTGRLTNIGDYTYTISCSNSTGKAEASAKVSVTAAAPIASKPSTSTSTPISGGATFCSGRLPCYGPGDIAAHSGKGNCWGWLGDRVVNVSGFDTQFHQTTSGVGSIELSGICGKNLLPAISGDVSSSEYPSGHDHTGGAKSASDPHYASYFAGYFDSSKP
jgi:hypothetical protein